MLHAFVVEDIPLIKAGDDIASIICERSNLEKGDIVIIASTIVSKAEGMAVKLSDVTPSSQAILLAERVGKPPAIVQLILDESDEVLVDYPFLLVCRRGHVCVNAGIDESNVENGYALLLPRDPDGSADTIRKSILKISGVDVAVIITDTCGRAFREGQCAIALGCSGLVPILDWRGSL
ncbi:MAG: coenzyme F420-0:L-glutamate ligase, partial [Methermicoccaceae archaeon]